MAASTLRLADRARLTAWVRERAERGLAPPIIDSNNIGRILHELPHWRISEKQRILLQAIERRTSDPSTRVRLDYSRDYPLAWASGEEELGYTLNALHNRGLISEPVSAVTQAYGNRFRLQNSIHITPDGWDYLDSLERADVETDQVFVAMWFDPSMESAWTTAIQPTLRRLGYQPYRVDKDLSNAERIDSKIQREIRRSKFLLAEATGQRQGVYFEAGYAMGLGLPVIWSVRSNEIEDLHFDTRQFPHIVWSTEPELEEELEARVMVMVGAGQGRVS